MICLYYDQVGTLKAVTDKNKNIVKEIIYDTYGNILSETNPSFTVAFGFGGGLRDRDTNLVHFGYREYEPYTGKWTAKDPIDFGGGDSNLYGYVLGDPVGFVDPEGLVKVHLGTRTDFKAKYYDLNIKSTIKYKVAPVVDYLDGALNYEVAPKLKVDIVIELPKLKINPKKKKIDGVYFQCNIKF